MDEPRGFPIRMTRLRWAHVAAAAAAAVGLFLPWVSAGPLSVHGIETTPGVIYLLVLILAVIFAFWHGARTSNYWYALDSHRFTGSLLCLSWLVLLAVAVYESVHLASAHSPTTGKAEVLGIGLAIDTMAALAGSVVATIDAVQNWSRTQVVARPVDEDTEPAQEAVIPPAARIRMLRPIGAWAIAAVGILAVAGAGLAGHNAGWTPIARPVSHTTHRATPGHGSTAARQPGAGGTGASSTTGPTNASTTTTTAPGPGTGTGNTGSAGNTGNTGAAFPSGGTTSPPISGIIPPVGIGNTPTDPGLGTPPVPSGTNTGPTGDTGSTGDTGVTGNTP